MYARVLLGNLLCVHVQAFEDFEVYSDDVCPVKDFEVYSDDVCPVNLT